MRRRNVVVSAVAVMSSFATIASAGTRGVAADAVSSSVPSSAGIEHPVSVDGVTITELTLGSGADALPRLGYGFVCVALREVVASGRDRRIVRERSMGRCDQPETPYEFDPAAWAVTARGKVAETVSTVSQRWNGHDWVDTARPQLVRSTATLSLRYLGQGRTEVQPQVGLTYSLLMPFALGASATKRAVVTGYLFDHMTRRLLRLPPRTAGWITAGAGT